MNPHTKQELTSLKSAQGPCSCYSVGVKKILKRILFALLILFLVLCSYFFIGSAPRAEKINWGVNFSQKHAENLGISWQKTYLALLDDLKVKNIKLITHWDLIEPEEGQYNFKDLHWQLKEAQKRGVNVILVIGMKTGRWPECHIPDWAENLSEEEQQEKVLNLIKKIVLRCQDYSFVNMWQVENEPFFPFGECPKIDKDFVKEEIGLVKSLDLNRPIIFSDSGEFSLWINAAKLGDIVGTTLHRKVWFTLPNFFSKNLGGFKEFGFYVSYPLRPVYYWRKAQIIKKLFNKEVICIELQAEPWCPNLIYNCSLEEQRKTMNLEQFQKNVEFAKSTGLDTFYLWGAEWWYWLKEKQSQPEIWNETKRLFE